MREYNPAKSPDRQQWLALAQDRRLELIRLAHLGTEIGENSMAAHCGMHGAVETQIAENTPGVRAALGRLRRQGNSRHNAVHAIGLILVQHLRSIAKSETAPDAENALYERKLAELGQA